MCRTIIAQEGCSIMKKAVICIVCVMLCLVCSLVRAKTYLLPDWLDAKFDFDGDVSIDASRCEEIGYTYYSSGQCPAYYNQDTCVFNDKYFKCDGIGWCRIMVIPYHHVPVRKY